MPSPTKKPKVFLSYARADSEIANNVAKLLEREAVDVWLEQKATPGANISEQLDQAMAASDFLVVLLSRHTSNSRLIKADIALAQARALKQRDITLIPVLLDQTPPPQELEQYLPIKAYNKPEQQIKLLINIIKNASLIDFSHITPKTFELLIEQLLPHFGFHDIKVASPSDGGFDLRAYLTRHNPPGHPPTEEPWFILIKHYRHVRPSLALIRQMAATLEHLPQDSHIALITSVELTSIANEWLERINTESNERLRVIEGTELKRILVAHEDLVRKFFPLTNKRKQ
ncbi:MAG TPA: TIR domain-containing protein [Archangium sp.]|uniref:TIR domain-containing protein n=1 Tax=Archangium sp. TaxID=1872627 RepID=UPI002E32A916|nr:TIR domain-containing protein [Archangium sp.]HEX5745550.1 TIR domain-containing protein [Archangium sp.]